MSRWWMLTVGRWREGGDLRQRSRTLARMLRGREISTRVRSDGRTDMADASVEVSGPDAVDVAEDLRAALASSAEPGDVVDPVDVRREAVTIAVIGLVFSGVSTAKTLWDWWRSRRPAGTTVKILLADGT